MLSDWLELPSPDGEWRSVAARNKFQRRRICGASTARTPHIGSPDGINQTRCSTRASSVQNILPSNVLLLAEELIPFNKFLGVAIGIFTVITLFQLITLPVEFDASRRAKDQLIRLGIVQGSERGAVSKVLNAAALTYVAAMVSSVLQLMQLVMLSRNRD